MDNHSRAPLALFAALLAVACGGGEQAPAPSAEAPAPAPAATQATMGSGVVRGTVTYANGDPDTAIKMDADPVCLGLHTEQVHTQKIVAGAEGQLANVIVDVKQGLEGKTFPTPNEAAKLDQKGCQYQPHVQAVQVNQPVKIVNSDPTLHNIHAHPAMNEEFNQGQPFQGMEMEKRFDKVEVAIPFRCDVHPWMASYVAVLEHPFFAVTGEDGGFAIESLPAGDYVIEAWHEELGTQTQNVTVAEGQPVELTFSFQPKA